MSIKDGTQYPFGGRIYQSYTDYYQRVIVRHMGVMGKYKRLTEIEPGVKAQVVVNGGRLLVKCPYCSGAERYYPGGLFMCLSCFNQDKGFIEVKAPKHLMSIKAILEKRPDQRNQNWDGETLAQLKDENDKHGIK